MLGVSNYIDKYLQNHLLHSVEIFAPLYLCFSHTLHIYFRVISSGFDDVDIKNEKVRSTLIKKFAHLLQHYLCNRDNAFLPHRTYTGLHRGQSSADQTCRTIGTIF